jgi:type I restriction enzyme, S subunit
MGQSPNGDSYNTNSQGFPLINGPVEFSTKFPIKIKWTTNPTKFCQKDDILFCVRGSTTGRMNIANDIYCIGRGVAAIRSNKESLTPFIELLLIKNLTKILNLTSGTTFLNLDSKSLTEFVFNLPPLLEQTKIANFLTAIDEKIQGLKEKESLLEEYKKGLMQQIFSQKLRFKQDDGSDFPDWEEKTLGEVATFKKGKGVSKMDVVENGHVECIRYGELYTTYKETIFNIVSRTNISAKDLVLSEYNDVIIPSSGETPIDIATASCVLKSGVALGGDLNIIQTNINGVFLSYYLNAAKKVEIASLAQGVSVVHLYSSQLKSLEIIVPNKTEQDKIANFLSSIDEKIEKVSQQICEAETYKKGLLQQLFV